VKLYQDVPPDDPGASTDTMKTLRDMMVEVFAIGPVPATIRELCSAVKVEGGPFLNHVAAFQLEVYESMPSPPDVHTLLRTTTPPLLGSAQVPLSTTIFEPLVVVVPAMAAVTFPTSAIQKKILAGVKAAIRAGFSAAMHNEGLQHAGWETERIVVWSNVFAESIMSDLDIGLSPLFFH
jgi:hypothetical protein